MRLFLRHLLLCALLMSVQYPAHADPVADAIREGGVALLMRHATPVASGRFSTPL